MHSCWRLPAVTLFVTAAIAQLPDASVWTAAYNNDRTGANLSETALTQQNVASLRKLATYRVDDEICAYPLVIDKGHRASLLNCTVSNTCYAFDTNSRDTKPLWVRHLANPKAGIDPVRQGDVQKAGTFDFRGNIGLAGTPVVDRDCGMMYVVARNGTGRLRHANSFPLDRKRRGRTFR